MAKVIYIIFINDIKNYSQKLRIKFYNVIIYLIKFILLLSLLKLSFINLLYFLENISNIF